ncbi:MAG: response regulator [Chloroflexota bacterium]|nr:response regulator [Chloroflexota bacterium]
MIRLLIADDVAETREHLARLVSLDSEIVLAGVAGSGEEAVRMAARLEPDVVLLDADLPDMDGVTATEALAERVPTASVIVMSLRGDPDSIKRAMVAGAREFLVKPFSGDDLTTSIREVYQRDVTRRAKLAFAAPAAAAAAAAATNGSQPPPPEATHQMIAIFAPKGGAGRTTIAANLALTVHEQSKERVALFDANFQFGDVGVLLNLNPRTKSIADAIETGDPDPDILESVIVTHSRGVRVLLAPPTPETGELITVAHVRRVASYLRETHAYTIVDLPAALTDQSLAIMDAADMLIVLAALEITSIKNVRLFLEVADQLNYARSKIRLVINRSDATQGIRINDVEASIRRPVDATIASDWRLTEHAVNRGVPFVVSHPDSAVSRDVAKIARNVIDRETPARAAPERKPAKRGLFALGLGRQD